MNIMKQREVEAKLGDVEAGEEERLTLGRAKIAQLILAERYPDQLMGAAIRTMMADVRHLCDELDLGFLDLVNDSFSGYHFNTQSDPSKAE